MNMMITLMVAMYDDGDDDDDDDDNGDDGGGDDMNEDLCHSLQHIGNLPGSLSTWSPAYNSFGSTWSMILGQD